MQLFRKKRNALEKWRSASRITDLHRTKLTIMNVQVSQPARLLPDSFYQLVSDTVPCHSQTPDLSIVPGIESLTEMDRHLSSKNFSKLYEQWFGQHDAPVVKYRNPDAWRNHPVE